MDHVGLGNAPQNEFVIGMGVENAVFQHRHIGMGTLGDDLAPVEYGLGEASQLGPLGRSDAGQQVQRLDVAVVETGILLIIQLDGDIRIVEYLGTDQHPQLTGKVFGIHVVALLHATGHLPIDEIDLAVHLAEQVRQQLAQRFLFHGDLDIQGLGAGIEPVQVILKQIDLAVCTHRGVIAAVTKEVHPVIEGNRHFLRRSDFAVVICKCFHFSDTPFYFDALTPNLSSTTFLMISTQLSRPSAAVSRQRS